MFAGQNDPDSQLESLINRNYFSINTVFYLLTQGASPDVKDYQGNYLLNILIKRKEDAAAKILIEKYKANVALALNLPESYQILPTQLNKKKQIGHGVYGTVFDGEYNNGKVAIKTILFHSNYGFCINVKEYFNETFCLATLTLAKAINVVKFIGLTIDAPNYYIVMENVELGSLQDCISKRSNTISSWDSRIKIIKGMTNGLKEIHEHFVHADFKSANVLLTHDLDVKIADFGLSGTEGLRESRGTPYNQAPEILVGGFNSKKSDIYSLGMTIWEVMALKLIEKTMPPNITLNSELFSYLMKGNRLSIPAKSSSLMMEMLVNTCWAYNPGKRLSVGELKDYLELNEMEVFKKVKLYLTAVLPLACKYGRMDFVLEYLHKEDINQIYQEGCTPIHLAFENGHYKIVEKLLSHGADIHKKSRDNKTLLHAAAKAGSTDDTLELIKLLLDKGVSVFVKNSKDETALDAAFKMKNDVVIRELLLAAKKLIPLSESVMSFKSIELAKVWVKEKALTNEYDDNFFENVFGSSCLSACLNVVKYCIYPGSSRLPLLKFDTFDKMLATYYQKLFIQQACTTLDKFMYIYHLLCEPLGKNLQSAIINAMKFADLDQAKESFKKLILKNIKCTYKTFATDEQAMNFVNSKSRTSCLSEQLLNANDEKKLFLVIKQIDFFPTPYGLTLDANTVINMVQSYLKNNSSEGNIPKVFGLRDKVVKMKNDYLAANIAKLKMNSIK